LTSTLNWFATELLTREENLIGLMALNRETLGQAESLDGSNRVVVEMDSGESSLHGEQEGSSTTDTSSSLDITRCCCSTAREIVWRRNCGWATCTAPKIGRSFYCLRSIASKTKAKR